MSVASVTEDKEDLRIFSEPDRIAMLRVRRTFLVRTDDSADMAPDVYQAVDPTTGTRIPRHGEGHPKEPRWRVGGLSAGRRDESPFLWDISVEYSTLVGDEQSATSYDPISRRPRFHAGVIHGTEEMVNDAKGRVVKNTAGFPFDPPPTRETNHSLLQFTYTRKDAEFDLGMFDTAIECVNSEELTVVGRHIEAMAARFVDYRIDSFSEGGMDFLEIAIELQIKKPWYTGRWYRSVDPWELVVESRGYHEIGADGKPTPIFVDYTAEDGSTEKHRPQEPVPLDIVGHVARTDAGLLDDPFHQLFTPYHEYDFRVFGWPASRQS